MSRFIEVTVLVDVKYKKTELINVDWIRRVRANGKLCHLLAEDVGGIIGWVEVTSPSYEQIRGVLMGKGELPAFYGLCPKCGLAHDMDQVCEEMQVCPKCDREMPCDCVEKLERCPGCNHVLSFCNCPQPMEKPRDCE